MDDSQMEGYMNLLSHGNTGAYWDETQFSSPPEEQQPPTIETISSGKASKRSKNFSDKEGILICLAWLEISMDAVQGNEQSCQTYWHRVHTYFHENKEFESNRGEKSLCNHWSAILTSVGKFCGFYEQIQNRRQSGITVEERVIQAMEMYKAIEKKTFPFSHCWKILHKEQKWVDRLPHKKQKTTSNASPGSSTPGSNSSDDASVGINQESDPITRPLGRKAEKERQRKGKSTSCSGINLYMEALDNLWSKRVEVESSKEVTKKERSDRRYALEVQRNQNENKKMEIEVERNETEKKKMEIEVERNEREKKKLEVEARKVELKSMLEEERIMNMDISHLSGLSDLAK